MLKMIVAIDGPAGSGKSTVARRLAKKLKLPYLDTGAMYRALTYQAMQEGVTLTDGKALGKLARSAAIDFVTAKRGAAKTMINGANVSRKIRTPELTKNVHFVASEPAVRAQMVVFQRSIAEKRGGVVEGRDIGTVVFPNSPYKFYLDADFNVRVRRRYRELLAKGTKISMQQLALDQKERDDRDFKRKVGPLKQAPDAVYIDTTALTIPMVVAKIAKLISAKSVFSGKK